MNISVAMATYNGSKYIRQQLDSLAGQKLQPYELVICDDGSTDNTIDIIEEFINNTTLTFPIKIFKNEINLGYANNFLKAASLCKGDWIAFCDQDDYWHHQKLEVVEKNIIDSTLMVVHSAKLTDKNLVELDEKLPNITCNDIKDLSSNHPVKVYPGFACVFHSKLIKNFPWENRASSLLGPRGKVSHDWWIYLLANVFGEICFIPDVLALYRRHTETVSPALPKNLYYRLVKIFQINEKNYLDLAEIAKSYCVYLDDPFICESDEYRENCIQGKNVYKRVYSLNTYRSNIYSNTNFFLKLKYLFILTRNNGYWSRSSKYSFGLKSFAKDLLIIISSVFR